MLLKFKGKKILGIAFNASKNKKVIYINNKKFYINENHGITFSPTHQKIKFVDKENTDILMCFFELIKQTRAV